MSDYSPDNIAIGNGPKPYTPRTEDMEVAGRPAATPASGIAGLPSSSLPGSPSQPAHVAPTSPQPAHRAQSQDPLPGAPSQPLAEVKGRIEVADEVVEKVAGLACREVEGVADLGGDIERALESVRDRIGMGNKRGDQGIKAKITGREVSIDVTIMIEYGHVVMDVARNVKANVASQTSRMLGLKVVEVNVTVDDVRLPGEKKRGAASESDDGLVTIDG